MPEREFIDPAEHLKIGLRSKFGQVVMPAISPELVRHRIVIKYNLQRLRQPGRIRWLNLVSVPTIPHEFRWTAPIRHDSGAAA